MGRGGECMKSFSEIKNQILKLRLMFEKDKAVDSAMWEKVVEAIDEGQLKGWLSSPNAQNLKEELSELEQELKALENF
jgi:ribosomal protein S20